MGDRVLIGLPSLTFSQEREVRKFFDVASSVEVGDFFNKRMVRYFEGDHRDIPYIYCQDDTDRKVMVDLLDEIGIIHIDYSEYVGEGEV